MKLTTKSRYGIRCVLALAINQQNNVVSIRAISQHLDLSNKYIESIFSVLKKHQFVTSVRGLKGGYKLAKEPKDINIYDIVSALESTDSIAPRHPHPDVLTRIIRRDLWYRVDVKLKAHLSSITIADIIKQNNGLSNITELDWYKQYYTEEI